MELMDRKTDDTGNEAIRAGMPALVGGYAVVTGASSGLGRCFALELARRGIDTILLSLPGSGVENVARMASGLGTRSIAFGTDMRDRDGLLDLCREINRKYAVSVLVNNVGAGGTLRLGDSSYEYLENIIDLNVTSVTMMTRALLPNISGGTGGYILNVSSMAALSPIGFKTIYPASKRFVYDFTRGLREELRGTGVSVSTILPGPMKTNRDVTARIERQGLFGKIGLLSPETVARIGIDGMFSGKDVIIPGWMNRMYKLLADIVPSCVRLPLVSRVVSRELDEDNRI